jgi:hypothetical protein
MRGLEIFNQNLNISILRLTINLEVPCKNVELTTIIQATLQNKMIYSNIFYHRLSKTIKNVET